MTNPGALSLDWPDHVDRFEYEYVTTVLLRNLNWDLVADSNKSKNRLVVLGEARKADVFRLGTADALLHLSDEGLTHPTDHYDKVRVILRNYVNPFFSPESKSPVFTVPLGFQSGFGARAELGPSETFYKWSFVGARKADRESMLKQFARISPHYELLTSQWADPEGLTPETCSKIYAQSYFVLCPPGNIHWDTFRVMEALEAGAIPVLIEFQGFDIFQYTFGNHPLPVAANWSKAKEIVERYLDNRESLEKYRKHVRGWFRKFKTDLASDVSALLSGDEIKVHDLVGDQWLLQVQLSQSAERSELISRHFSHPSKPSFFQRLRRRISSRTVI